MRSYRLSVQTSLFVAVCGLLVSCAKTVTVSVPNEQQTSVYNPYVNPSDEADGRPQSGRTVEVSQPYADSPKAVQNKIQLFFIAREDAGRSGELVGCGDSVVAVPLLVSSTQLPLKSAIAALLEVKTSQYGQSLYNALFQSQLKLKRAVIKDHKASVELSGIVRLSGTCDVPRIEAQLRKTAMQFPDVLDVDITLNGMPLAHELDASGQLSH